MEGPPVAITSAAVLRGNGELRPVVGDIGHALVAANVDNARTGGTFVQQHLHDLLRAAIAEQLAQRLFVPGDLVLLHQIEEIAGSVAAERVLGEMAVAGNVMSRTRADIGEIAPSAAGYQYLLAHRSRAFQHQYVASALTRERSTQQPGRAAAQNDCIESGFHGACVSHEWAQGSRLLEARGTGMA